MHDGMTWLRINSIRKPSFHFTWDRCTFNGREDEHAGEIVHRLALISRSVHRKCYCTFEIELFRRNRIAIRELVAQ